VYAGNLDYSLTEGDVICVLSQYGEVEDLHLVRDEATGKSKGFAFCKYEDSRSCVLAVDNLCGAQVRSLVCRMCVVCCRRPLLVIATHPLLLTVLTLVAFFYQTKKICGRSVRVDHVENYRLPKHLQEDQEPEKEGESGRVGPGHAYQGRELASSYTISRGQDLFAKPEKSSVEQEADGEEDSDRSQSVRRRSERSSKRKKSSAKEEKSTRKREREGERRRGEREEKKRSKKRSSDSSKKEKRSKKKSRERRGYSEDDASSSRS
jgi:RNA-binding motif X-linked protein 2